jgi:hypothetical protein
MCVMAKGQVGLDKSIGGMPLAYRCCKRIIAATLLAQSQVGVHRCAATEHAECQWRPSTLNHSPGPDAHK